MKKTGLFLILMLYLAVSPIFAQNKQSVSLFEFEIGTGLKASNNVSAIDMGSFSELMSDRTEPGLNLFMEARINIPTTAFDIGLQFSAHNFSRKWEDMMTIIYNFKSITTYVDYNYRKWNKITPFVGLGLGFSPTELTYTYPNSSRRDEIEKTQPACFNPRIGVEVYDHIRLTFDWKIMTKTYSHIGISLGFAFGGGKR